MHYIITDIHNDSWRFMKLLEKIDLKEEDHLYLERDLRDFVKEEDAFMRCLEQPLTHCRRAGKNGSQRGRSPVSAW